MQSREIIEDLKTMLDRQDNNMNGLMADSNRNDVWIDNFLKAKYQKMMLNEMVEQTNQTY
jgi:hypothetical protein